MLSTSCSKYGMKYIAQFFVSFTFGANNGHQTTNYKCQGQKKFIKRKKKKRKEGRRVVSVLICDFYGLLGLDVIKIGKNRGGWQRANPK